SLMHRVETVVGKKLPRVGLSATLGEMALAREFLRPGQGRRMDEIISRASGQDLQVQVRGYTMLPMNKLAANLQMVVTKDDDNADQDEEQEEDVSGTRHAIAAHMYKVLRGSNNLIFPNSRDKVEWYADRLRHLCENDGLPNEFLPHHGSLSRDLRE
ncbi:DEAD/DEAH box helicase, partial [Pseudomonas savastanoi pv. glycinea]